MQVRSLPSLPRAALSSQAGSSLAITSPLNDPKPVTDRPLLPHCRVHSPFYFGPSRLHYHPHRPGRSASVRLAMPTHPRCDAWGVEGADLVLHNRISITLAFFIQPSNTHPPASTDHRPAVVISVDDTRLALHRTERKSAPERIGKGRTSRIIGSDNEALEGYISHGRA